MEILSLGWPFSRRACRSLARPWPSLLSRAGSARRTPRVYRARSRNRARRACRALRAAQNLHEIPIELLDNRRGRARGREEAGPGGGIEPGDAGFLQGRRVGMAGWAEWDTFEAYFGKTSAWSRSSPRLLALLRDDEAREPLRIGEQGIARAVMGDAAAVEDHRVVRGGERYLGVLLDENQRERIFGDQSI